MRQALNVLLFVLLFCSCKSTTIDHVWLLDEHSIEKVKGPVKEIITGDSIKDGKFSKVVFDQKGDMTNRLDYLNSTYELDGKSTSYITTRLTKYKTVYNNQGNRMALICDEEGSEFYPDGRTPTEKWQNSIKYHLDIDGRPISDFNKNDTIGEYKNIQYNKQGTFITWTDVGNAHMASQIYRYQYDKNDRIVREDLFEDSTRVYHVNISYQRFDARGNWMKKSTKHTRDVPPKSSSNIDTITRKITYY